jgi:hypothetical protein
MDRHDSLWSLDLMVSVLFMTRSMRNMVTAWKLVRLNWRVIDAACILLFFLIKPYILFDCLRVDYGKRCISRMME